MTKQEIQQEALLNVAANLCKVYNRLQAWAEAEEHNARVFTSDLESQEYTNRAKNYRALLPAIEQGIEG